MSDLWTAGLGKDRGIEHFTSTERGGGERASREWGGGRWLPWLPGNRAGGAGDASHGQSPFPLCVSPCPLSLSLSFSPFSSLEWKCTWGGSKWLIWRAGIGAERKGGKRRFLHPHSLWLLRTSLSQPGERLRNSLEKFGTGGAAASRSRYWSPMHGEGAGRVVWGMAEKVGASTD